MNKLCLALFFVALLSGYSHAAEVPRYKPSSRAPEPVDITANLYGASSIAPNAFGIGETAPDFTLPISGGGQYTLSEAAEQGPVVLIFYRGHW